MQDLEFEDAEFEQAKRDFTLFAEHKTETKLEAFELGFEKATEICNNKHKEALEEVKEDFRYTLQSIYEALDNSDPRTY
jgi:hypothetical protein